MQNWHGLRANEDVLKLNKLNDPRHLPAMLDSWFLLASLMTQSRVG